MENLEKIRKIKVMRMIARVAALKNIRCHPVLLLADVWMLISLVTGLHF
jgi:hypothetical protein